MTDTAPAADFTDGRHAPDSTILRFMGIEILDEDPADPTLGIAECPLTKNVRNIAGVMNGGVVATVIDTAGGTAAARATRSFAIATAAMNIQYLGPISVGPGRAEARVLRKGARSVVVQVDMVDVGDGNRLAATGTMNLIAGPPNATGTR